MSKETTNTIDAFDGWENASDVEFFGTPATEDDVKKIIDEVEKTDLTDKSEQVDTTVLEDKKEDDKEDVDIKFFESPDEITEEDIEDDTAPTSSADSTDDKSTPSAKLSKKAMVEYLKEKKLIDFELEEGEELTDDIADEILEDSFEEGIDARLTELTKSMPDSLKHLVKFAANGGDVDKFLSQLAVKPTVKITKDLDLEDEANQELVVRTARAEQGDDADTIDTYIEYLKESNKLKMIAGKDHKKIVESNEQLLKNQAETEKARKQGEKERQRAFKSELAEYVEGVDNISSMPINKLDKKNLPSYIADRSVTMEDGRQTTAMQRDLLRVLQDKEKSIVLAKLLKNNFDFSEISKVEKTKYTKEVKQNLSRSKQTTASSSSAGKRQSFADFF